MLEILEKIIPISIYGFITTIAGGCIAILIQYIRLQYEVKKQETAINDLGKKIDDLIEIPGTSKLEETINNLIKLPRNEDLKQNITKLIELLYSNINKDEKESYLNSLEVEIIEPRDGETITKEGSYTIKGIIRNILIYL
ncbi:MAG: hypothetical protein QNJ08_04470 [Crocosphaera sp.]|nr:hypothetical protein [Crocosphaera sp.]